MQISNNSLNSSSYIAAKTGADRLQRDAPKRQAIEPNSSINSNADLDADSLRRADLTRAIVASRSGSVVDENLPRSTQQALKAFESNKPTLEQQLGIEIIGIDTYA